MEIQVTNTITLNVNGTNYTFDGPHPIEDLLNQFSSSQNMITILTDQIAELQVRLTAEQAALVDTQNQIQALCVTPAP